MKKGLWTAFFVFAALTVVLAADKIVKIQTDDNVDRKVIKISHGGKWADLNLTDEQRREFKRLDLEHKKSTVAARNQLEVSEAELEYVLDADDVNLRQVNNLIDDIYDQKAELEKQKIATRLKKRDLLTDEQKEIFDDISIYHHFAMPDFDFSGLDVEIEKHLENLDLPELEDNLE